MGWRISVYRRSQNEKRRRRLPRRQAKQIGLAKSFNGRQRSIRPQPNIKPQLSGSGRKWHNGKQCVWHNVSRLTSILNQVWSPLLRMQLNKQLTQHGPPKRCRKRTPPRLLAQLSCEIGLGCAAKLAHPKVGVQGMCVWAGKRPPT